MNNIISSDISLEIQVAVCFITFMSFLALLFIFKDLLFIYMYLNFKMYVSCEFYIYIVLLSEIFKYLFFEGKSFYV